MAVILCFRIAKTTINQQLLFVFNQRVNPLIVRAARLELPSPNCAKNSGLSTTNLPFFGDKIAILTVKMIFYKLLAIAAGIQLL